MPRDVKRISESEEYFNILWLFFPYSYFLYSGLEINGLMGWTINPLCPDSDQNQFSPNNIQ